MKSRHVAIDLTLHVLRSIAEAYEVMSALQGRDRWIAIHQGIEGLRRVEQERLSRDLRRRTALLKHRRYIKETRLGYVLTGSGEELLAKKRIQSAPQLPEGRWLAVLFDFPERSRSARNSFRGFLKASGFVRVQQSVWVTRRDASEVLKNQVRQSGFEDWVKIWMIEAA